jgi:hypothetical protein
MVGMPHFLQNRAQRFLFSCQFLLQEFLPPPELLLKHARPRLPRKRHPCQKCGPVPLRRPIFAFECIGKRRPPLRRSFIAAPLRPRSRLVCLQRTNHPGPRQFFERVINLRSRNPRPVPNLAPLQFRICLIPVHRALRQQTQKHQVWRGQPQFLLRSNSSLQSLRAPLGSLRYPFSLSRLFLFISLPP